jgi:hypothetical protein
MTASDGVTRAVEIALEQADIDLDVDLVRAVLAIEVDSQFNAERSISISRVSETVETAIAHGSQQEAPSEA